MKNALRSAPGPTNFERLREPFRGEAPVRLSEGARSQMMNTLVVPGEETGDYEVIAARLDMLREAMAGFPPRLAAARADIARRVRAGAEPVDAIYLGLMTAFDACVSEAARDNPAFQAAVTRFRLLHMSAPYLIGARTPLEELRELSNHGLSIMIAFMEAVPAVYEETFGEPAGMDDLQELIPAAVQPAFSSLSRVPGPYAIHVEQEIGIHAQDFSERSPLGWRYFRWLMFIDDLELKSVDGRPVLDVSDGLTADILADAGAMRRRYHGCLAGLVRMNGESGPSVTAFDRFTGLVAEEMRTHWFPRIAKN